MLAGDAAYTVSHDALTVTPRAGGATIHMAGDRLTVYRKRGGRWLLARAAHPVAPGMS
jgi:ketosteroid isomerase-like protein